MKTKKLLSNAILIAFLFPIVVVGQSKWAENDDMYFSRKDRTKIYASVENLDHSAITAEQSEYAANHNFNSPTMQSATAGSPTVQTAGNAEDANNQYFIKDYSLPKDKTYESVPINTYGNIQSFNNRPNVNVAFGMGYGFGSPYFGNSFNNRFYNPYNDPFNPYYDPFFNYNDPWNYASFGHNPWGYNRFGSWGGNNRFGVNRYYNSANWCPTNGYTNYSSNVRNEVRYRNGRKVISGSRSSATRRSSSNLASSDRPVKSTGSSVGTNGRSSNRGTRNSYRKYPNSAQNRSSINSNSGAKRGNTYNRTNRNSNSNNWNNNSNSNRSNSNRSNSYRSSGSSSGSRSSSFSKPSNGGSRSGGSSRPSSSGRSGGGRKR